MYAKKSDAHRVPEEDVQRSANDAIEGGCPQLSDQADSLTADRDVVELSDRAES